MRQIEQVISQQYPEEFTVFNFSLGRLRGMKDSLPEVDFPPAFARTPLTPKLGGFYSTLLKNRGTLGSSAHPIDLSTQVMIQGVEVTVVAIGWV